MTGLSPEAESKLELLKQEYIKSLPEKTSALELCWNSNLLEELRIECHKIAGSAASFELADISFAARTLEALCRTRLEHSRIVENIQEDKTLVDGYAVLIGLLQKNSN